MGTQASWKALRSAGEFNNLNIVEQNAGHLSAAAASTVHESAPINKRQRGGKFSVHARLVCCSLRCGHSHVGQAELPNFVSN